MRAIERDQGHLLFVVIERASLQTCYFLVKIMSSSEFFLGADISTGARHSILHNCIVIICSFYFYLCFRICDCHEYSMGTWYNPAISGSFQDPYLLDAFPKRIFTFISLFFVVIFSSILVEVLTNMRQQNITSNSSLLHFFYAA